MNDIQVFNYSDSRQVRTVEKNGEAWFVAKDVCDILGIGNITESLKSLDHDEKGFFRITEGTSKLGGNPNRAIINEPGMYKLIFKSRKAKAKDFTRWVTHIVLPEIRRKGYYNACVLQGQIIDVKQENALLRSENELLQAQNAGLKKYIQENSSFTMLGQAITPIKGALSVGEAAKIFAQHNIKIGQNRLYKLLRDMNMVAKRKGRQRNQPTQKSIEQGLCVIIVPFGSKGIPYLTMKGLQKVANVLSQEQFPLLALMTGTEALHE